MAWGIWDRLCKLMRILYYILLLPEDIALNMLNYRLSTESYNLPHRSWHLIVILG